MADPAKQAPLVWIDLEMTGLDPATCAIVQLGLVLTDFDLQPIGEPLEIDIWQPESVLERMDPFVRTMHENSGLLEKIRASKVSVRDAEQTVMKRVSDHAAYREARLCGNSIHSDRKFLEAQMPQLAGFLHYRMIDVSAVKELARAWFGVDYAKPESSQHTALFDIEQSIEELRFYRGRIFRKGKG